MAPRYRKVEVVTWTDARFQSLSAPQPNGQTLWLYFLCGPRTTTFPGLIVAREQVMAADLGWSVDDLRATFREASREGLAKGDFRVGVVVLQKALLDSTGEPRETSRPESPNVLKGWARSWDEVPDCSLKAEYLRTLESFAKGLGEPFRIAFAESFRRALLKASLYPSPNQDQDQDQDQEQEQETNAQPPAAVSSGSVSVLRPPPEAHKRVAKKPKDDWTPQERASAMVVLGKLSERNGVQYTGGKEHLRLIIARLRDGITELELRAVIHFCASPKAVGGKGWEDSDEMRTNLCPETLFGPRTISRYLDPARSWAKDDLAKATRDQQAAPLALVSEST